MKAERIRKRALALLLLALLMLSGSLSAAADFPADGLRVAVASDLHFNPDDVKKGRDATAIQYNMELVDALLWDAGQQGAKMILLTGDLVNGGKYPRHAALAEKLRQAEKTGLEVYVVPGNHDLAPTTQTEFAEFYAAFGYDEAYSRDAVSLSYCIVRDGLLLLMLDTGGYSVGAIDLADPPAHEDAFLSEETLRWAETMLQKAADEGLHVLCAGHYNLLPEISRQPGSGYCLQNGDHLAALLRQYGAPLYLSGHMHLRAVYREDGLTELLTEYLLGYPTGYSLLDLTDGGIRYAPRRIDVESWARQEGLKDRVLLDFADWQQDGLREYAELNVAYMSEKNPLSRKEKEQAADFFYAAMDAYWDGSLSDRRAELEAMPGYGPFFRCAEGYAYGWWLRDLIGTAVPELRGFTLAWQN